MFSNSYNKKIQSEVLDLNKRFIQHQQRVGRSMLNDATNMVGGAEDPWAFTGGAKEGAGILSGLLSDIGLGKPKRGGQCACEVGETGNCCGGKKRRGRPRKAMGKKGKGIFSGLLSKIGLGEGDLVEAETGGKKRRGRPRKGMGITGGADTGGKKRRGRPRKGGNWVDDMTSGISQGMNAVLAPIASVAQSVAPLAPLLALGKPKRGRKGKGITGGADTGGKRKKGKGIAGGASKWISHVKKWAKDHKMKYNEALKDAKCKMAYRK